MDATNSNAGGDANDENDSNDENSRNSRNTPVFVTSNENKRREVEQILGIELSTASPDIPEIQDTDFVNVATAKVLAARAALGDPETPIFVDDSGIEITAWNGFPGALTKWLGKSVGNAGILKMMDTEDDRSATAVCTVVLADANGETHVFRGEVRGTITPEPRGDGGFGYDPVFQPDGQPLTYAQMEEQKSLDSHRTRAFVQLREFLRSGVENRAKGTGRNKRSQA